MNFEYIVANYKWADGFTPVRTTKLTRWLADSEWGMLWLMSGGCLTALLVPFALGLFFGEAVFGLSMVVMLFGPILPLQLAHHIAEDKLAYNKEILSRAQLNLFRDFDLK